MYLQHVTVYRPNMAPMGSISGWSSFIWTERYQEPGDFEIRIPTRDPDIQRQVYLYLDTFIRIPYSNETMIVEEVKYEGGRKDSALYIRGRDAKTILERRAIVGQLVFPSGPGADEIVRSVFETEITAPAEASRRIDRVALDNPSSWTVHHIDYNPRGKSVWDFYLHCARAYRCGLRTYMNGTTIRFQFWRPIDRTTAKPGINPVVFSEAQGNLINAVYRKSTKTYKTTAYVHVEGGPNNSVIINEDVSNAYAKGLNRREMVVNPGWENQSQMIDDPELRKSLRPYGVAALYEHAFYDQVSGDASGRDDYEYGWGKDYFLGDKVNTILAGQVTPARVKEYTHSWTVDGAYKGYPTLDASPEMSANL